MSTEITTTQRLPYRLPEWAPRITWSSAAARDVWESRITRISNAHLELERELVVQQRRRAALQFVTPDDLPKVLKEMALQGLCVLPLTRAPRIDGYQSAAAGGELLDYRVAITRPEDAAHWPEAWERGDNERIGELLGYPRCCRQFFKRAWVGERWMDTTWPMALSPDPHSHGSRSALAATGRTASSEQDPRSEGAERPSESGWGGVEVSGPMPPPPNDDCVCSCDDTRDTPHSRLHNGSRGRCSACGCGASAEHCECGSDRGDRALRISQAPAPADLDAMSRRYDQFSESDLCGESLGARSRHTAHTAYPQTTARGDHAALPSLSTCVEVQSNIGTNMLWRWLGVRPVSHLPCSFACEESARQAARALHVMEQRWPEEAVWLREILSWPVKWTALHGIAEITSPIHRMSVPTDATLERLEVRYMGTGYPAEGAVGIGFPHRTTAPRILQVARPSAQNPAVNGFSSLAAMNAAHNRLLEAAGPGPFETVLDLGCGDGTLLSRFPAKKRIGVESNPERAKLALQKVDVLLMGDCRDVGFVQRLVSIEEPDLIIAQRDRNPAEMFPGYRVLSYSYEPGAAAPSVIEVPRHGSDRHLRTEQPHR